MSSLLATTLFASSVAAQLTTSIWLPGAAFADIAFVGSVIEQDGDRTTLSLDFASPSSTDDELYPELPPTVTIGGATFAAYTATAVDLSGEDDTTVTISLGCERANTQAVPTCTMSTAGLAAVYSQLCSAAQTDGSESSDAEDFCTEYSDATTVQTLTLSGDSQYYINNFPLTITAGTEKLSAVPSPTASGASSTASASAASRSAAPASAFVSGSGLAASTGSIAPSASGASVPSSSFSGAAAPMRTMVPALAGIGAAAAAFFL